MSDIVVGVTSVGSGIGQSVVDACLRSDLPIRLIGLDSNPFAFAAYDCAVYERVPRVDHPDYLPVLLELCRRHGISVLVPGLDLELTILAGAADAIEATGAKLLVGSRAFVDLCRDKLSWSRQLRPLGETVVASYEPTEARAAIDDGRLQLPAIGKPRGGSASIGITLLKTPADLYRLSDDYVVQPLLLPESRDPNRAAFLIGVENGEFHQLSEVGYQIAVGRSGVILGDFASLNRMKSGVPVEVVPVDPAPFRQAVEPFTPHLLELGMRGPVNFQGRVTDDGVRFYEMNGRFTGITGLRALLGFNEVDALIRDAVGLALPAGRRLLAPSQRRVGIRQVTDRVVDSTANPELAGIIAAVPGRDARDPPLRILLTGATGFLGNALLKAMLESPRVGEVVCPVRSTDALLSAFDATNAKLVPANAADAGFGLAGIDAVYHLASSRPPHGDAAVADALALTRRLIDEAIRFQTSAFVFVSSQAVYGNSPPPWHESDRINPRTPYGMAKAAGEELVRLFGRLSPGSRATSLRLTRIYGARPRARWDELPHKFAQQAADGEQIVIHGGDQRYDLLHVDDAVSVLIAFLEIGRSWQQVYNLGSGRSHALAEIADAAIAAARAKGVACPDFRIVSDGSPAAGVRLTGLNIDRIVSDIGWRPKVELAEGIADLVRVASERQAR